ncbi:MAG: hypothetical protein IIA67_11430 [Planctomycetes bacterium]|nr:hypothetical protein [Planctomycetota bacterium]
MTSNPLIAAPSMPATPATLPSPLARLQAVTKLSSTGDDRKAEDDSSQDDTPPVPAAVDEVHGSAGPSIDDELLEEVLEALASIATTQR